MPWPDIDPTRAIPWGENKLGAALAESQRETVAVALTRGQKLVVLVGQKKAVGIAVRGSKDRRRWSKLRERLAG